MRTLSTAMLAAIIPTILTASHAVPRLSDTPPLSQEAPALKPQTAATIPHKPRPNKPRARHTTAVKVNHSPTLDQDLHCLALNIYHEARSEPESGQIAVARVTLNRVQSEAFPKSVCGVVKQGGRKLNRCQFSWWCDGQPDDPTEAHAWQRSLEISRRVLADEVPDPTNGALYYHTDYVKPKWSRQFQRTTRIGRHLFYRPSQKNTNTAVHSG